MWIEGQPVFHINTAKNYSGRIFKESDGYGALDRITTNLVTSIVRTAEPFANRLEFDALKRVSCFAVDVAFNFMDHHA